MPKVIKRRDDSAGKPESGEEQLRETIDEMRQRIRDRQRTLVIVLGVFLAVLAGIGSFFLYSKYQKEQAATFMREGLKSFYGDFGQQQPVQAGERYAKAIESFKKAYEAHKSAVPLLYEGYALYELGRYEEAIKPLKYLTDTYSDPKILPLAQLKLAQAYMQKGDATNALTLLNDVLKGGSMQDVALIESARILAATGKPDEAKAKYELLLKTYPQSPLAQEAKARLGQKG